MLIIALVLALIGLVALVFAVVTSNELVAWVCIGASVLGVVLLIIDALRERQRRDVVGEAAEVETPDDAVDYPEEVPDEGEQPAAGEDTTAGESSQGLETSDESAVHGDDHAT
ncbi:hypothetical protein [Mycobacterium sp. 1081908.1]|uniref:hypothetical protein n=1 Tax=Mycobacterium sp. 1081908.1 TaxID=1834066 RepID=UPI0007FDF8B8|nr:hypothetical protein [Mycobacterium sp. 1081908.1]OBK50461.1 hypothetical protein A5655_25305 [Mycobacterium sp. 1081908.1]